MVKKRKSKKAIETATKSKAAVKKTSRRRSPRVKIPPTSELPMSNRDRDDDKPQGESKAKRDYSALGFKKGGGKYVTKKPQLNKPLKGDEAGSPNAEDDSESGGEGTTTRARVNPRGYRPQTEE